MKDILKVVKLDFLSVMPYFTLKNLIIFILLGIFYSYLMEAAIAVFISGFIIGIIYSSYPFIVGDVSNLDSLYSLCGISRKNIVKGRYLTAVLLSSVSALFCFTLAVFMKFAFNFEGDISMLVVTIIYSVIFMIFVILIQYPFFFKLGYMKGKMVAKVSTIFMVVAVYVGISFSSRIADLFFEYPKLLIQIVIPVTIVIVAISYIASKRLSLYFYEKRDF